MVRIVFWKVHLGLYFHFWMVFAFFGQLFGAQFATFGGRTVGPRTTRPNLPLLGGGQLGPGQPGLGAQLSRAQLFGAHLSGAQLVISPRCQIVRCQIVCGAKLSVVQNCPGAKLSYKRMDAPYFDNKVRKVGGNI